LLMCNTSIGLIPLVFSTYSGLELTNVLTTCKKCRILDQW
jgi:hypothetical protein